MTKRWFALAAIVGAFIVGVAVNRAHTTTPLTRQPTIVASFHRRDITASIPTTTLFIPPVTGVFRASGYIAMTSSEPGGNLWYLNLNWTDDAGPESYRLSTLASSDAPPKDYGEVSGGLNPPFTFEAVAGQPVTFFLQQSSDGPLGTLGLTITIERLQ